MPGYSERLREHLGPYKQYRLGVNEDGLSRSGFKHGHILPETFQRLNILETYRKEFWQAFDEPSVPKAAFSLQPGFHQLDATQAMCFNLFVPFVHDVKTCELLLRVLGRKPAAVAALRYDRLIDRADMLRCDFFMELEGGTSLTFELKLAEESFDAVLRPSPGQVKRLKETYTPLLTGKVPDIYLREQNFFRYDQILRNIALLQIERADHLYIVFPKGNDALRRQEQDINDFCSMYLQEHVTIVYLDELVGRIEEMADAQSHRFRAHFEMFREKYLIPLP